MTERDARRAARVGLTLDDLQAETDQKALHQRRTWLAVVDKDNGKAQLATSSFDLLIPYVPNVRPYEDYHTGKLSWTNRSGEVKEYILEIGHVVRLANGVECIIVSFRFHFESISQSTISSDDATANDQYEDLKKGRHCLAVLEIEEKRVGHKMKADLGPRIQEINADRIVAVGESTGSDPVASEARLLRSRFEDSHDLGGSMFPDQVDPAVAQGDVRN